MKSIHGLVVSIYFILAKNRKVCVDPRLSNMTLPASAAERMRRVPAIDQAPALSSKPAAAVAVDRWDGLTDNIPLHRPYCAPCVQAASAGGATMKLYQSWAAPP